VSTIGTGTFGRVILVRHQTSRKYLALKVMYISDIIKLKQVDHVRNEKCVLDQVGRTCPFIVRLYWTHHTMQHLYMMLEYVPGGDFFTLLKNRNRFDTRQSVFYASEIVAALEYLHTRQIVYRDLKPENLLLDVEGHLKLTDFGFAKKLYTDKTYTLCGTPEYLAPELLFYRGHNMTCDWWSLGIIIYEFLYGSPPFYDDDRNKVYEKIIAGKIEWPRHFDSASKDIIKKLLVQDPTRRLGSGNCGLVPSSSKFKEAAISVSQRSSKQSSPRSSIAIGDLDTDRPLTMAEQQQSDQPEPDQSLNVTISLTRKPPLPSISHSSSNVALKTLAEAVAVTTANARKADKTNAGCEEVKRHRWFISIGDWSDVYAKKIKPPFVPEILHAGDTRNFDRLDLVDLSKAPCVSEKESNLFLNF
jgi:protein kinase X